MVGQREEQKEGADEDIQCLTDIIDSCCTCSEARISRAFSKQIPVEGHLQGRTESYIQPYTPDQICHWQEG